MTENRLLTTHHILWCLEGKDNYDAKRNAAVDKLRCQFCGVVLVGAQARISQACEFTEEKDLYVCGDVSCLVGDEQSELFSVPHRTLFVIKELSTHGNSQSGATATNSSSSPAVKKYHCIDLGRVPVNVHNVGVYYRKFFPSDRRYFDLIRREHAFYSLTEANKPGQAFRKGIYLSRVTGKEDDELRYHFLRCSSNLDGATDNFRDTDEEIVNKVNSVAKRMFEQPTTLNHVLAQVYENTPDGKKKARIKAHSDKTKDMPIHGLIAFCSFYDSFYNDEFHLTKDDDVDYAHHVRREADGFDYLYRQGASVLPRLRFRLKQSQEGIVVPHDLHLPDEKSGGGDVQASLSLPNQFDVVLYPNSVFLISLQTNRLYTHGICPSVLPTTKIPTRLGYVIRCSNTLAAWKDGETHLLLSQPEQKEGKEAKSTGLIPLVPATVESTNRLRNLYYLENTKTERVDYGLIDFSLNRGDYLPPKL